MNKGKAVNLTMHKATPDQVEAGIFDLEGEAREQLLALLDFAEPPTAWEVRTRAADIADLAVATGAERAMIGGALWLMHPLAVALLARGIFPAFAFTRRETVEQEQADGTVRKVAVFRFAGWVPVVE